MKISFRKVTEKDLKRLNEIVNDAEVAEYLDLIPPVPLSKTREFFEHIKATKSHWWSVLSDGCVVGGVGLLPFAKSTKMQKAATFFVNVDRGYWGMGVGDAAVKHAISYARKLGLKRIEFVVVKENERAIALYERNGFHSEGVKEKAFWDGKRYRDLVMMARIL